MKEMVGGCCVCSDEQGWADNPLVYCDGKGCNVAVHQACYGIEAVPSGPWYCKKCEYRGDKSKVVCKLCPNEDGALKRTDTNDWAHVICALYIPEVEFGNVKTMEPILINKLPKDRFNKLCYICELNKETATEQGKGVGACMACHKFECPNAFHVTCGQKAGLLCEKRNSKSKDSNIIKYTGFCSFHYKKEFKPSQFLAVPAYIPPSLKEIEGAENNTAYNTNINFKTYSTAHQENDLFFKKYEKFFPIEPSNPLTTLSTLTPLSQTIACNPTLSLDERKETNSTSCWSLSKFMNLNNAISHHTTIRLNDNVHTNEEDKVRNVKDESFKLLDIKPSLSEITQNEWSADFIKSNKRKKEKTNYQDPKEESSHDIRNDVKKLVPKHSSDHNSKHISVTSTNTSDKSSYNHDNNKKKKEKKLKTQVSEEDKSTTGSVTVNDKESHIIKDKSEKLAEKIQKIAPEYKAEYASSKHKNGSGTNKDKLNVDDDKLEVDSAMAHLHDEITRNISFTICPAESISSITTALPSIDMSLSETSKSSTILNFPLNPSSNVIESNEDEIANENDALDLDLDTLENCKFSENFKSLFNAALPPQILSDLNLYQNLKNEHQKLQNHMKTISMEYTILKSLYNSLL